MADESAADEWGLDILGTSTSLAEQKVAECESIEFLRGAMRAEAQRDEGPPRKERMAIFNKRVTELENNSGEETSSVEQKDGCEGDGTSGGGNGSQRAVGAQNSSETESGEVDWYSGLERASPDDSTVVPAEAGVSLDEWVDQTVELATGPLRKRINGCRSMEALTELRTQIVNRQSERQRAEDDWEILEWAITGRIEELRPEDLHDDPPKPGIEFEGVQCRGCGKIWSLGAAVECPDCGEPIDWVWNVGTGRISEQKRREFLKGRVP